MEIKPFLVDGDMKVFSNFSKNLESAGYENAHTKAVKQVCSTLKEILRVDLLKQKACEKVLSSPRSSVFVNPETNGVVMLTRPVRSRSPERKQKFSVVCFSHSQRNVDDIAKTLMGILIQKTGVREEGIHEGDKDENANRHCIKNLSTTRRSELINDVKTDMLNVFVEGNARTLLKALVTFPFKVFREDMFKKEKLGELDIDLIVSVGIFDQLFSPTCKKCREEMVISPFLFDSKRDIEPILEKKTLVCPSCGHKLGMDNTIIMRYLKFSKLGLEMAKGLWLEAYIVSLLRDMKIPKASIITCALHGKDELDILFSDGKYLNVCECKDRTVGQNDVYVVATKASRISADKKIGATADRVLMISTEPISKDIMPEEQTEDTYGRVEYIPIGGELSAIKEKLVKIINESRRGQKKQRIEQLSALLVGGLSFNQERFPYRSRDYLTIGLGESFSG